MHSTLYQLGQTKNRHTEQPTDATNNNCLLIGFVETRIYSRRSPGRCHKQHATAERHGSGMRISWTFLLIFLASLQILPQWGVILQADETHDSKYKMGQGGRRRRPPHVMWHASLSEPAEATFLH